MKIHIYLCISLYTYTSKFIFQKKFLSTCCLGFFLRIKKPFPGSLAFSSGHDSCALSNSPIPLCPPVCCSGCRVLSAAVAHLGARISPEVTSSCFSHTNITFGRGSVKVLMSPWSHSVLQINCQCRKEPKIYL